MIAVKRRRWQQQLGNPAPIGFIGFGIASMFFGFILAGWTTGTTGTALIWAASVWTGGFAVLFAAVLDFVRGNTFEFMFFAMYGSLWLTFALMLILPVVNSGELGRISESGSALLYLIYCVYTGFAFVGSFLKPLVLTVLLFLLLCVLVLLAISHAVQRWSGRTATLLLETDGDIQVVAGYFVMAAGVVSIYYGEAIVNGWPVFRSVLPRIVMDT